MTESAASPIGRWRYGMHPRARGMQVRSLGRVDLPLGEALRLELGDAGASDADIVHLQYYISTDAGPWALWLSCPRQDVEAQEQALRDVVAPFTGEPQDRPPALHRSTEGPLRGWDGDRT